MRGWFDRTEFKSGVEEKMLQKISGIQKLVLLDWIDFTSIFTDSWEKYWSDVSPNNFIYVIQTCFLLVEYFRTKITDFIVLDYKNAIDFQI